MQSSYALHGIAVSIAISAFFLTTTAGSSQIIVDDAPLSTTEVLTEAPVVAYRAFPKGGLVSLDPKKERWALDGTVLYKAAGADTEFQKQVGKSRDEITALPLRDLVSLYQSAANSSDIAQCSWNLNIQKAPSDCRVKVAELVDVKGSPRLEDSKLDTAFVREAFSVGAFDNASISMLPVAGSGGNPAVGVTIDPIFAKRTSGLYGSADRLSASMRNPSAALDFGNLTKVALGDASISQAAVVLLTTVAIGHPLILRAEEKGLKLPSSISDVFDVYWVQLAVNPREDLRGKVDELSFFVSLKTPDSEALDLVPLRYGTTQDVKTDTGIPETKIKAGDFSVSLGQIYSQEISYKTLKPTIVGTGIQDSEFGWSLTDEMIDMSAKSLTRNSDHYFTLWPAFA